MWLKQLHTIHYVAFSHVRNLSGLQILEINEEKIIVSNEVKDEVSRMANYATLKLCFTPIYQLETDALKIVFHNTRSFHKHYIDIKCNHLIKTADIIGIAETRLTNTDKDDDYGLTNYSMCRNDQQKRSAHRPSHGLAIYNNIETTNVLSQEKYSSHNFEYILNRINFHGKFIQVVVFYISPKCDMETFNTVILNLQKTLMFNSPFILIGDTNLHIKDSSAKNKIYTMEKMLKFKQFMSEITSDYSTVLDHIYFNIDLKSIGTIDNYWSDHKITYTSVTFKT